MLESDLRLSLILLRVAFTPTRTGISSGWRATFTPAASQRFHFVGSQCRAAFDDRAGMPHALSGRSGLPGDEADHRLGHVVGDKLSGFFFIGAADLADHHNFLGLWVVFEHAPGSR